MTLLPPPLRRSARRLHRRTALRLAITRRHSFSRLIAHFLTRLIRGGNSSSDDPQIGIGALLGILATPGAFQCFLMLDKYSSFLNWMRGRLHDDLLATSVPDKYMFLSLAMGITGIVTVTKWDRILPDSQDFLNLAPLPIRPRTLLLANATAIAIAVTVILVCVNGASSLLFPFFVSAASFSPPINPFSFIAVHALCVTLASLSAFCFVFASLGILAAILPRRWFLTSLSWLRGAFAVGFIGLLLSGFSSPALIRAITHSPFSTLRLLPPMWYLGLYQVLQHRPSAVLTPLASIGLLALAAACGLSVLAYAMNYSRSFAVPAEASSRSQNRRTTQLIYSFFYLFGYLRPGFRQAAYRFIIRTLLRNESQRFCLAISLGLGWLLAMQSAWPAIAAAKFGASAKDDVTILAAPLMAAYALVLGLRICFDLPATLSGNWIFRSILNEQEHESTDVVRRVVLAFLAAFVLFPAFGLSMAVMDLNTAALHTLYISALSLCLSEVLFLGYRRIPFTCSQPAFRDNLPVVSLLHVFAFFGFARAGAFAEHWMLRHPPAFTIVPVAMFIAWHANRTRLRNATIAGEIEPGLSFDAGLTPAVQRLRLFDGD